MNSALGPRSSALGAGVLLVALATWAFTPLRTAAPPDAAPATAPTSQPAQPLAAAFAVQLWQAPPIPTIPQPAAETSPPPANQIPPLGLRLLAITTDQSGTRVSAVCFDAEGDRVVSLRARDLWRERVVAAVETDRVVLAGPLGEEVLALRAEGPSR